MTWMFVRSAIIFRGIASYHFQPKKHGLSLSVLRAVHNGTEAVCDSLPRSKSESTSCYDHSFHHSPLFSKVGNDYKIDIVDDETWQVSTGFANVWKDATAPSLVTNNAQVANDAPRNSVDPDFDEIDDLRICGDLFYKLDRDSKEYEEYDFDAHGRKPSKRKTDWRESKTKKTQNSNSNSNSDSNSRPGVENVSKIKDEIKMKGNTRNNSMFDEMEKTEGSIVGKRQRVPTFNQLTGPYHEPFCLDIYISKASIRACIVHRATSKVVAVAHSISKDMKFDLGSTRNAAACAAVGKVLAQRALADDIHNVIYTPRKGEKLEGKLQNVLQSVLNNGVWVRVKVKIKKTNVRKAGFRSADYKRS